LYFAQQVKQAFDVVRDDVQSLEGSGLEAVVNSSYYRVLAEYHKVVGPADDFYNASLQFLAYTPLDSLAPEVQVNLAIDMSLAALVGQGVFNFGEVLAQPILATLDNTPNAWLHELLKVYSAGDIERFNDLFTENKAAFEAQPVLVANMELLRQKLALLCLMQIVFLRPPEERSITFDDIAESTKLGTDQVEWLLMRAMSRGLIKGRIDEIAGVINVTWLKPRVLDASQMSMLQGKLEKWTSNVVNTLSFIESETPELFQ
jgi:26S proteasome regulatory subunit N9